MSQADNAAAAIVADPANDKRMAVAATVANQLHQEGRWPPNNMTKVMGTDYHYARPTIGTFLGAVKWNLRHGAPAYDFTFDGAFEDSALGQTVAALMVSVNANTTAV